MRYDVDCIINEMVQLVKFKSLIVKFTRLFIIIIICIPVTAAHVKCSVCRDLLYYWT